MLYENSTLENFKNLKATEKALAEAEAAKVADKVAIRENWLKDYHIKMDMKARTDAEHARLMEAARDQALSSIIKAIYITALEAETLTDEGLLLAENMVDNWIKERGGASKILSTVGENTYLLNRIYCLVEDTAEATVEELEKDELSSDEPNEKKVEAEDKAKEFIDNADKEEIKDFMNNLIDKIQDKAEDEGEKKEEVEDAAEDAEKDAEATVADLDMEADAAPDTAESEETEKSEEESAPEADEAKEEEPAEDSSEEVKDEEPAEEEKKEEESEEKESEEEDKEESDDDDDDDKEEEKSEESEEDKDDDDEDDDDDKEEESEEKSEAEKSEEAPEDLQVDDTDADGEISDEEIEDDTKEDLGEPLDDDGVDADTDLDGEIEDNKDDAESKMFDELEDEEDVQKAIELIRTRVADAEETFIRNNAEDKKKMNELLNKISNNVKTVEDLADKDPAAVEAAKESAMYYKGKMNDVKFERELTVFERMSRILTENIVKNDNIKDMYLNEAGQLDIPLVIESAKVMYAFLETLNTIQIENVDEKYITKVFADMKAEG